MRQLGQFDLHLAFVTLRALGEDVEDQRGPVDDVDLQAPFEIALLRRRERVVEDDQVGSVGRDPRRDLVDFAGTDEGRRVGALPPGRDGRVGIRAGRPDEQGQFVETRLRIASTEVDRNEQCFLQGARAVGDDPARVRRPLEATIATTAALRRRASIVFGPVIDCRRVVCGRIGRRRIDRRHIDRRRIDRRIAVDVPDAARPRDRAHSPAHSPACSTAKLTARAGTTVEIACL